MRCAKCKDLDAHAPRRQPFLTLAAGSPRAGRPSPSRAKQDAASPALWRGRLGHSAWNRPDMPSRLQRPRVPEGVVARRVRGTPARHRERSGRLSGPRLDRRMAGRGEAQEPCSDPKEGGGSGDPPELGIKVIGRLEWRPPVRRTNPLAGRRPAGVDRRNGSFKHRIVETVGAGSNRPRAANPSVGWRGMLVAELRRAGVARRVPQRPPDGRTVFPATTEGGGDSPTDEVYKWASHPKRQAELAKVHPGRPQGKIARAYALSLLDAAV